MPTDSDMQLGYETPILTEDAADEFMGFKIRVWVTSVEPNLFRASGSIDRLSGDRHSNTVGSVLATTKAEAITQAIDAAKIDIRNCA